MIIYLDENLPHHLAEGLDKLQQPLNKRNNTDFEVKSVASVFGRASADEDWIPRAGSQKAIAITCDSKIRSNKHQKKLYEENGLGMFFFPGGIRYWDIVRILVDKWEDILKCISSTRAPFAYKIRVRGKIERLD